MLISASPLNQCQKPSGWLGRFTLRLMNASHSRLTDWGLAQIVIDKRYTILDIGCGGGRTVGKLAALATEAKVVGVDYSEASVAATTKLNAQSIAAGRVEVRHASVSQLPFPDGMFDLVTAVETHFWWPNLPTDMREVFRITKPGGQFVIIAEVYKRAGTAVSTLAEKSAPRIGLKLLTVDEHRELFANAGFSDIRITTKPEKSWICAIGRKP